MKCLSDVVMILEYKGKEASDGGIILPEGSKKRTYRGTVVAVGPGKPLSNGGRYKMTVRVGDVVAYPERTGDKVTVDGQEMLAIPEQYLICVLVETDVELQRGEKMPEAAVYRVAADRFEEYDCECGARGPHVCVLTAKAEKEYHASQELKVVEETDDGHKTG